MVALSGTTADFFYYRRAYTGPLSLPKCFEASSKRYNRHRRYVMPGLACGKTSPLAWQFLQTSVDYFILISDSQAVNAMKKLARSRVDDISIVAGDSGAAGLAALLALNYFQKKVMHISAQPPLILFNTEGPTAPTIYQELVGKKHTVILDLQMTWLQKSIAKK